MGTLLDLDQKRGQNFLTGRALEALVAMLNVLLICIVTLTPHIAKGVLAAFILLTSVASAISPVRALRAASREERRSPTMLQRGHRPKNSARNTTVILVKIPLSRCPENA